MPAWTDYTSKTTPADTDEVMIKDFSDSNKANKRMLFSGLWNWIVNKLTNAVIANLETSPQTIVGAINSLNSNIVSIINRRVEGDVLAGSQIKINFTGNSSALIMISGPVGNGYASYLYQGYGISNMRQHVAEIQSMGSIVYEIAEDKQQLIITNNSGVTCKYCIESYIGYKPTIS